MLRCAPTALATGWSGTATAGDCSVTGQTCGKTSYAATGTPLAGLHSKERFFEQGECLANGMTVREAADALGASVSTAFRLRHRFLQAVQAHQPQQVSGLLEADETYFRESKKGCRKMPRPSRARGGKATPKGSARDMVPVLVGRVRGTHQVADSVLTAMIAAQAEEALRSVVGPDTLLCTGGSGALRTAAAKLGVTSKSVAVGFDGRVSEGVYHVRTVNNYHERFKTRPGSTASCAACRPSTCPTTSHGWACGNGLRRASGPSTSSCPAWAGKSSTARRARYANRCG